MSIAVTENGLVLGPAGMRKLGSGAILWTVGRASRLRQMTQSWMMRLQSGIGVGIQNLVLTAARSAVTPPMWLRYVVWYQVTSRCVKLLLLCISNGYLASYLKCGEWTTRPATRRTPAGSSVASMKGCTWYKGFECRVESNVVISFHVLAYASLCDWRTSISSCFRNAGRDSGEGVSFRVRSRRKVKLRKIDLWRRNLA